MANKRIVVTGASGVLGSAVTRWIAKLGPTVIGVDMTQVSDPQGPVLSGIDLTDPAVAKTVMDEIGRDGPIDGIVNIVGGFRWETVADGASETWDWLYRINVGTAFNASRSALPYLPSGSAIVNVGAAATLKALAGMGAYTASKSGVARLTEAMADELKERGIRVNAVLPSIIDTPANRKEMGSGDAAKWVRPDELAAVIGFLLSAEASGVTGACLPVTGRL